ncbi:MAG: antitoxin [Candidatus Levybacteria bacterium CG10_big_fil_rev_8_21_14_0_10_35_13]|nr:MAG: antitoxin [Candidatus Levybacteria bacterium CG10_big_fil_rev_8_21_14_0_10_35_13]
MPTIIETKPNILGGMPVLKGTRIPIARVVALFVQGYKVKDFKRDYPYLTITKKDIADIFSYYSHLASK